MEFYYDVFRLLSLMIVWAIPAILIVAVVVFVIGAPALTLGGVVLRLSDIVSVRLRRKPQAETQTQGLNLTCSVNADCPRGFVCVNGYCVPTKT